MRRYWTNRYLLTLIIGLAVITLISALWIRHNTLENRLNMMIIMAQGIADRFDTPENRRTFPDEDLPNLYDIERNLANSNIKPVMYIIDNQGTVLSSNKPTGPFYQKLNPAIVNNEETIQEISLSDGDYYVVKVPITIQKITVGSVVMLESKERLSQVNQEYSQLAIMIRKSCPPWLGSDLHFNRPAVQTNQGSGQRSQGSGQGQLSSGTFYKRQQRAGSL